MEKLKALLARIAAGSAWRKFMRCCRHLARRFEGPHFHRFEVVFMRVLFAVVIYQTMPLGEPFSDATQRVFPKMEAVLSDSEKNRMLRPPLPPLSRIVPDADPVMDFEHEPRPNGIARIFSLTWFSDPAVAKILPWLVFPALALYISGFGLPVALPILTLISLISRTLHNSQGAVHHEYQMITLVLLAQTVVVFWRLSQNPGEAMGFRKPERLADGRNFWDLFIRYTQWMIIVVYVVAGVIKPIKSEGQWFANSHYIGIQVVKTHRQNYYNRLEEKDQSTKGDVPLAKMMMQEHPNLIRLFLGAGVLLEICAFLALWNRFTCLIFGLGFISFHYFNDRLMGLYFYNFEKMDWIFLVNLPFWIWWLFFRKRVRQEQEIGEVEGEPEPAPA